MAETISFLLSGEAQGGTRGGGGAAAADLPLVPGLGGEVMHSVRLGARRGGNAEASVRVEAEPGRDVVVLQVADGPTLVLHPETARDLLLAQTAGQRDPAQPLPREVGVPESLQWQALQQLAAPAGPASRGAVSDKLAGLFGSIRISALQLVRGVVEDKAAELAAGGIVKAVDAQVDNAMYRLSVTGLGKLKGNDSRVDVVPAAPDGGPLLVLLHGTFSTVQGTFHKLWESHPNLVGQMFAFYADRVYGFDHPTLGESPIANALTLVKTLPAGARLHLLSHSRGGLVGEVLARVCAQPDISAEALALFAAASDQQQALKALGALVKAKGIKVERFVRVACPARGTLLASKRLDAYVSVLKWTLELAHVPVAPELVGFLGAVAKQRTSEQTIPGLAAQVPGSPLITWLHAADEPLPGQLRVVAGDMQGDSIGSWMKTLLADSLFWTDNDLVVQTSSMYGGAPRRVDASYLLSVGGQVSHFSYFDYEPSAEGIVSGLIDDAPQRFQRIGPMSAAGLSAEGWRGTAPDDGQPAAAKPAVFVLPGILGSNLAVGDQRIWLGVRVLNGLKRLELKPGDGVRPDGPVGLSYDKLIDFLGATHEVVPFGYDWRKPLADEARRLAAAIEAKLDARKASGQPVRLIAHSMGGLLARTMQIECPATWDRLMAHKDARLLMLGTPNGGSWAPMSVLSGDDTFGNVLVDFGAPFQDHSARQMMAQFPGFIELQAGLTDPQLALDKQQTWADLADRDYKAVQQHNFWHVDDGGQLNQYRWGVPDQAVLDQSVEQRRKLDAQRTDALPKFADKLRLVVGHAKFTPAGMQFGEQGLSYLNAESGDGRVPLESAMLPGVRAWQLDCEHGDLGNVPAAFPAYLELLQTGNTALLAVQPPLGTPAARGAGSSAASAATYVPLRPSRMLQGARAPASAGDLGRLVPEESLPVRQPPAGGALRIGVLNGDLKFVRHALVLGHYRSMTLTGTELAIDRLIGGTMHESLAIGRYPDLPGTLQIFANTAPCKGNPLQMPRPANVIVVGLGAEGSLRGADLAYTVRQGVIAWAQKTFEQAGLPQESFELAATLIGSGGSGVSPGLSAQWIAQGVADANERLADPRHNPRGWPRVGRLTLVELYLDRAAEAWRALQAQAAAMPSRFRIDGSVESVTGALRRPPDSGYRGASYDLISAIASEDLNGAVSIAYTLDTKRARSEMQARQTQGPLVRELVRQGSNDHNQNPQIGRTLFRLLVPIELGSYLAGTSEMLIELNHGSASIPWEMLDTQDDAGRLGGDQRPWAIRCKLLRKLRIEGARPRVQDASFDDAVLVIGEPLVTTKGYPRLAGARNEATAVAGLLGESSALGPNLVHALVSPADERLPGPDAGTVINKLMERDWRIVHIAGHGEPPLPANPRGVVLSGDIFLGWREIEALRVVPELVFINCCHLGAIEPMPLAADAAPTHDRAQFAASAAEALIRIGVRCVVAAGWAVDDAAASTFATGFYKALLNGRRFMDAVALARESAAALGGNTWAAYQCYGDPDWIFRRSGSDAQTAVAKAPPSPAEEFAGIASSPGLALAVESIGIQANFDDVSPELKAARQEEVRAKLRHLEGRFGAAWGGEGAVAEAFGYAWNAAGDRATALDWYRRAVAAPDGSASFRAIEQLGNLQVRQAEAGVRATSKPAELRAAMKALHGAIDMLVKLATLQPTMERLSLVGSAWKRMALMADEVKLPRAQAREALTRMVEFYERAEALGRQQGLDSYYPAVNAFVGRLTLGRREIDERQLAEMRQVLVAKNRDDPDFWSVVGLTELRLFEAIARSRLQAEQAAIAAEYAALRDRVSSTPMWDSVHKQTEFLRQYAMAGASAAEQSAAAALVAQLRGYAGGGGGMEGGG